MSDNQNASIEATPEQVLYANILAKGMLIGLIILFITFAIYAFGIMKPYIPLDQVSSLWTTNVGDYLHNANIKPGWAWVGMLQYGDFLNFIGIAVLAGVTIVCYIGIIPSLLRSKDTIFVIIAILEVIVLSVAASGILGAGGH
ncbi:MAG: DUF1634 domain-containing protein [Deltaproteobacteria bacterium]|nr:DUF1634 domain-containing protein [Deltaproteobacteria bacterium]MBW1813720.1 DUF1634 domain-containing protein [Deltaproteobacteria bacterium]MBW1847070.1 DUF1634 domain-containing protein [Deltaproteobacteria bacterium]MBW1984337.1 DUF1634 domain-containing protein [Deltaproteobacteria bacterium]MBW2180184.1 DUF1634 domain-containing protein [Deltaproteobacteria bacterium]